MIYNRVPAFRMEYEVVWNGRKSDPSLLSDYPRQSSLAPIAVDPLGTRRKGVPKPRPKVMRRQPTFDLAKAHAKYLEARCGR